MLDLPARHRWRRPGRHELRRRDLAGSARTPSRGSCATASGAARRRAVAAERAGPAAGRAASPRTSSGATPRSRRSGRSASRAAERALHHGAQLAAAGDAEVERGADALGGQRQAVAGGVAHEEDAVRGRRRAAGAGSSCPGSGRGRRSRSSASSTVVSLTWKRGSNEPTPMRSSSPRGEAPAVAGRHVAAVDPDLQLVAGAPSGCTSRPRESGASGGWKPRSRRAPAASRARRRSAARVRSPRSVCTVPPVRPSTLAVSKRGVALAPRAARTARGSRRSRSVHGSVQRAVRVRRVHDELAEGLADASPSGPAPRSQSVGIAQAEVWRSPIS